MCSKKRKMRSIFRMEILFWKNGDKMHIVAAHQNLKSFSGHWVIEMQK